MALPYRKSEAKDYAREHMKGIWAAALTPFAGDGAIDEAAVRRNLRHWIDDLEIDGFFISGKQGEFFAMSLDERKRCLEIAVEECAGGPASTIMSCSDQNLDVVIDLAQHAEAIGSPYIVVHAPVLHFNNDPDDTVYEYYRYICERVDIAVAMWSHPDSGYLMSPELCSRVADLPNVVAIKYSVPREMYARLTDLAGDRILVSTASEDEWFDNIVELGWRLYLCSSPPYLIQTAADKRMREYTDLAFAGETAQGARGARQPRSGAQGAQGHAPAGQAAQPPEILAGPARPDRRPCPPPRPAADRGREGGDARGLRLLRARSGKRGGGRLTVAEANRDQIEFWSTTQGHKWLRLEDRIERMMTPFTEAGLAALGDIAGRHCLDIGCGAAGTTLALADAAGESGSAAGIDVSPPLLERAWERAEGRKNVCFAEGDAQDYAFREDTFDILFSRFGIMFFKDTAAALANLRRASKAGRAAGLHRLARAAGEPVGDDPGLGGQGLRGIAAAPGAGRAEPVPVGRCRPGDRLAGGAGWRDCRFEPLDIALEMPGAPLEAPVSCSRWGPGPRCSPKPAAISPNAPKLRWRKTSCHICATAR